MRIVYAGDLTPGGSCLFRLWALRRLGHEVIPFDPGPYQLSNPAMRALAFRLAAGPHATKLNYDLLEAVQRVKPDLLWVDKVLLLTPGSLDRVRERGVLSVSYMIDNAFGPRRDPGWRMYVKTVPHFDLHVTQRDVSLQHYMARRARHVMKVQTAYEPTVHFPPEQPLQDAERTRDVSFIGSPYDDRPAILKQVAAAGFRVSINGEPGMWRRALGDEAYEALHGKRELYGREYREAIWRSRINLSFLTHSNEDEYAHKSFEIAGCGGFLLAEQSDGHTAKFRENVEAVFCSGAEELIEKIRLYLPDEGARERIAAAGYDRARRDGYSNDVQMQQIMDRVQQIAQESRRGGS